MGTETIAAPRPATVAPAPGIAGELTRRASLTAVASVLDYAVKALVYVVVTPVLVSGLGRALYGVWEVLSRLGGFMSVTDGHSSAALRLLIARKQADGDDEGKRRTVGAALRVWLVMVPVVVVIGAALAWWVAPALIAPGPEAVGEVRLTFAILVGSFLATSLGLVPESVLRGMNQGYRRMGVQAGLNLLGGGLAALAVWQGLGLVGLGGVQVVRAAITGLAFWLLVRRFVSWWGASRPLPGETRALFGMSLWLTAGDVIAKIFATDVVILGAIMGPEIVTSYALTGYAAHTALGLHIFAAGAAIPGMGGLMGTGEISRAARARRELLLLTWLFVTVVGATILLWNPAFTRLWVGSANYAGTAINLLIFLIAAQTAFIRTDAYIIDAALQPQARVRVSSVAALITIGLSIPLTFAFGVYGLCAGRIAGRSVQSIAYPILVRRTLGRAPADGVLPVFRLALTAALLLGAAAAAGSLLRPVGWFAWAGGVLITLPLATALALLLGPGPAGRQALRHRLRVVLRLRSTR